MVGNRFVRQRLGQWLRRCWIVIFLGLYGIFVGLPFLAPALMKSGWEMPARAIYFVYSFLCHQLPERSYFLFGPKVSYSLAELHAVGQNIANPFLLRRFIGSPQMGWKVAWSDRMVSLFTSIWVAALVWGALPASLRQKKLSGWGLALFLLPMALDGGTHTISDFAGLGLGFRDSNLWLAVLTRHAFAPGFYAGDAWGSFNALARALTGALAGIGFGWFLFPWIEETLQTDLPVEPADV